MNKEEFVEAHARERETFNRASAEIKRLWTLNSTNHSDLELIEAIHLQVEQQLAIMRECNQRREVLNLTYGEEVIGGRANLVLSMQAHAMTMLRMSNDGYEVCVKKDGD